MTLNDSGPGIPSVGANPESPRQHPPEYISSQGYIGFDTSDGIHDGRSGHLKPEAVCVFSYAAVQKVRNS